MGSFQGIISGIRRGRGGLVVRLSFSGVSKEFFLPFLRFENPNISIGDFLSLDYEDSGTGFPTIMDFSVQNLSNEELNLLLKKEEESLKVEKDKFYFSHLSPLKEGFERVLRKLLVAKEFNRFTLVKFHADADGISSALMLKSFMNAQFQAHTSPRYTYKDFLRDLPLLSSKKSPFVVILDFGSSEDSKKGIEALSKVADVLVIDHHEPSVVDGVFLFNPRVEGISDTTAGMLVFETLFPGFNPSEELLRISLAGDKTMLERTNEEDRAKALTLDFLSYHYSNNLDLNFASNILYGNLWRELHAHAVEELESAVESVLKRVKPRRLGQFTVCFVSLQSLPRTFPPRSKVATVLKERLGHSVISYYKGEGTSVITFRISESDYASGLNALEIVRVFKEESPSLVISGGGHEKASTLVVERDTLDYALRRITELIPTMFKRPSKH